MSGTFMAPIYPLSLPTTNHKRYAARPSTLHYPNSPTSSSSSSTGGPTSLAHDLLAKHSAAKWLKKQRREYEVNRDIRQAKREAAKAEEVQVGVRERQSSLASSTDEGKITAAFAG